MDADAGTLRLLRERFPGTAEPVRLADLTTWRIGGPAVSVSVDGEGRLRDVLGFLREQGLEGFPLGRGSNLLADDRGTDRVLLRLVGELARAVWARTAQGWELDCGGGVRLPSLAGSACVRGASGLVFAVGIPGTVGGAIFMNAGAYGGSISEHLAQVRCMDASGRVRELEPSECGFDYRRSLFQEGGRVVTGAVFRLPEGDPAALRSDAASMLAIRRRRFPLDLPNAGSVFRRPPEGDPPGRLIEDAGLKGLTVGGARVSRTHANFIVNLGGASSADVLELVERVREAVLDRSGIRLREEIRYLGRER